MLNVIEQEVYEMASLTKYCGTASQTTGGKYCSFSNLNNIKNNSENAHAVSNVLIQGKNETPNRPSTISCTNFNFNLPVGAEPTKVIVSYRHRKVAGSDYTSKNKHVMNIPSPTVSLLGVSGYSGKGVAPTLSMTTSTKTFNVAGKLTRTQINSSSFGARINYPTNTNSYNGYMRVSFIRITVEYKTSKYGVSVKKVDGGYNGDDYTISLSVSNKNNTNYNPSLTLTSPLGFNFKNSSGTGTINQVNARTFRWDPKLTSKVGTSSINLVFSTNVTFPSGETSYTGTFTLVESLNGSTANYNAIITEKPTTPSEEESTGGQWINNDDAIISNPEIHNVEVDEEFNLTVSLESAFYCISAYDDPNFLNYPNYTEDDFTDKVQVSWDEGETWTGLDGYIALDGQLDLSNITGTLKCNSLGEYAVIIYLVTDPEGDWNFVYTPVRYVKVDCIPKEENFSTPNFTIIELGDEELNRLGNGYSYVFQAYGKVDTIDGYARNWYKNHRLAVFNNAIEENITITEIEVDGGIIETINDSTDYENLTPQELFANAGYWGNPVLKINEYENLECEFSYNEDYPLYLLVIGDYPEVENYGFTIGIMSYTEPCIIEKQVYHGRETNGNYLSPVDYLITEDGSTSQAIIPVLNSTSSVILYEIPLDEGYGTTDTTSIRGIEVTGILDQSDELILTAKLTNPLGAVGERTIVLNNIDATADGVNEFKIGGLGDLWGFNSTEIVNFEDWEIEFSASNLLLEDVGNISVGSIQIILYTEQLIKQDINIKVNGEDLSFFGAFIDEVKIPEGLETDTGFLSIDGTDTNDAYRQNIREKEIEINLTIGDCDIGTSTDLLRQLTKTLVNDKDSYNRPIPNTIEFSHYPDVYFEYIMKDALQITPVQSDYEVKATLIIPSGTSFSKQAKTTNISGYVQGLAAINPIISLKPQGGVIEILETISEQRFTMGYNADWQDKIVEIDCNHRMVYLKTNDDDNQPVDISKFVDFNSDWFAIKGQYSFNGTNCVIRTVEYTERW